MEQRLRIVRLLAEIALKHTVGDKANQRDMWLDPRDRNCQGTALPCHSDLAVPSQLDDPARAPPPRKVFARRLAPDIDFLSHYVRLLKILGAMTSLTRGPGKALLEDALVKGLYSLMPNLGVAEKGKVPSAVAAMPGSSRSLMMLCGSCPYIIW